MDDPISVRRPTGHPATVSAEYIGAYIDRRVERGELAANSAYLGRRVLTQWFQASGGVCDPELAAKWVHDPELRPASRHVRWSQLRGFARWLASIDVSRDFMADCPKVRRTDGAPRDLSPDAVGRLVAVCDEPRIRLVVLLMVHCGLRCVDISRIRMEDIDVTQHRLRVRAKGGRGEVTHVVPVPGEAWSALLEYLEVRPGGAGHLIRSLRFVNRDGLSAERISKLVRVKLREARLKAFPYDGIGAHSLRHSCAQHMFDRGASIAQIQGALGHRQITTTQLYLRHEVLGLAQAMDGRHYGEGTS